MEQKDDSVVLTPEEAAATAQGEIVDTAPVAETQTGAATSTSEQSAADSAEQTDGTAKKDAPRPNLDHRAALEETIGKFALDEAEKHRLETLFNCYKQLHDLCYVKRTFGECARRGFTCEECALGKNLQAVRNAFGIEHETVPYSRDAERCCAEYMSKVERDCDRADRHYRADGNAQKEEGCCPCESRPCGRKVKGDDAPTSCAAASAEPTADAEQTAQKGAVS